MSELERLVHEMAAMNTAFYPLQIILGAIAVSLGVMIFIKPGKWTSRGMKLLLGFMYSLIAWGVAICYINLRGTYYLFTATVHGLVAILFFLSLTKGDIEFDLTKKGNYPLLSSALMLYGVIVYPIMEIALGYNWPGMFVFGALCPTGVFAVGTLLSAHSTAKESQTYRLLLGLVSIGAIICGGRTILIGGVFDFSYFGSGLVGVYYLSRALTRSDSGAGWDA